MSQPSPEVRIIILNWRGAALLPQCLPSLVEAARQANPPCRVSILNNPSDTEDDGRDYVRRTFPEVEIHEAPENKVLCSFNEYLPQVREDIVILLNNDIRADPGFVDPLIQKFREDPDTFLVAPRVMDFEGTKTTAGPAKSGMRWGLFWCEARYPGFEKDAMKPSKTFTSGFGAFSRKKFLSLNGYDERYHPGIMEDVDLCWRAHRAGYKCYYEPASVLYHIGQASFKSKIGAFGTSVLAHRNTFLFMWKNFKGPGFWLPHLFFLPLRLVYALLSGNRALFQGFFEALKKQCRR